MKLTDNEAVSEEIASDTFVKLWNNRSILKFQGSIKSYLYTTVKNGCIDHIRKRKKEIEFSKNVIYLYPVAEDKTLTSLIEAESYHEIIHSLEKLPPKCGLVLRKLMEGDTHQQIAEDLDISPHTVRNQKIRALRILKDVLPR